MSGTDSPHGFTTTGRGERGYRPAQVEQYLSQLSADRDAAWERAARLTVLANEMAAEAERLREVIAQLPPLTYEELGEGAQLILATAEQEAERLRAGAWSAAKEARGAAAEYADATRDAADAAANALRTGAERWAEQRIEAARVAAAELREAAERDALRERRDAVVELHQARERTEEFLAEQEQQHADRWEALGVEIAEREAALESRIAELEALGERTVAESQRAYAAVEEAARHGQEDAEAQGEELIARARARAERVERETEQILRAHAKEREELTSQMEHVRESLGVLTGRRVPVERRAERPPATPDTATVSHASRGAAEAAGAAEGAAASGASGASSASGTADAAGTAGGYGDVAGAGAGAGAGVVTGAGGGQGSGGASRASGPVDAAGAAGGDAGESDVPADAGADAGDAGRVDRGADGVGPAVPRPLAGPGKRKLGDDDDTIEVELPVLPPADRPTP
ncbi:cellulose-binding protein [Streptomyces buecherae]|uniref:Cellulose-binding protein n=1 Tax=Streptomyces buecherae TaxID=2763006 RepID=A0A7H8NE76_9ACTN|nr:cellulose-binding protein [Streptomyces buecherae]QKW52008.1 cellulose-binding protein [Streptomyces buecherae]